MRIWVMACCTLARSSGCTVAAICGGLYKSAEQPAIAPRKFCSATGSLAGSVDLGDAMQHVFERHPFAPQASDTPISPSFNAPISSRPARGVRNGSGPAAAPAFCCRAAMRLVMPRANSRVIACRPDSPRTKQIPVMAPCSARRRSGIAEERFELPRVVLLHRRQQIRHSRPSGFRRLSNSVAQLIPRQHARAGSALWRQTSAPRGHAPAQRSRPVALLERTDRR